MKAKIALICCALLILVGAAYARMTVIGVTGVVAEEPGGACAAEDAQAPDAADYVGMYQNTTYGLRVTSSGGYSLTQIGITLSSSGSPNGVTSVSLYNVSSDFPGTEIAAATSTIDNTAITSTPTEFKVTISGGALSAQDYFVVLTMGQDNYESISAYLDSGIAKTNGMSQSEGSWAATESYAPKVTFYSGDCP